MTSEQIEAIARAVAEQQLAASWLFYLVMALLTIVTAAIGSFVGAYLKKRGEHFATTQDFERLLREVEQMTEAATAVKTQIERAGWTKKEYVTLKRQKAEIFLESVQEVMSYVDTTSKRVFFDDLKEFDDSPGTKVNILAVLYFPEIAAEALAFAGRASQMMGVLYKYRHDTLMASQKSLDTDQIREAVSGEFLELRKFLNACANFIEFSVANSIAELAGIEGPYDVTPSPLINPPQGWPTHFRKGTG